MKSLSKQASAKLQNVHHAPLQSIALHANTPIFWKLSPVSKHAILVSTNIIKHVYLIAHFLPTQSNPPTSAKTAKILAKPAHPNPNAYHASMAIILKPHHAQYPAHRQHYSQISPLRNANHVPTPAQNVKSFLTVVMGGMLYVLAVVLAISY
jgi:hypothetical protein